MIIDSVLGVTSYNWFVDSSVQYIGNFWNITISLSCARVPDPVKGMFACVPREPVQATRCATVSLYIVVEYGTTHVLM